MTWRTYQCQLGKTPLRIIKKADYDAYERRARSRQRLHSVAGVCMVVVLAGFAAALTWAVAAAVLP